MIYEKMRQQTSTTEQKLNLFLYYVINTTQETKHCWQITFYGCFMSVYKNLQCVRFLHQL